MAPMVSSDTSLEGNQAAYGAMYATPGKSLRDSQSVLQKEERLRIMSMPGGVPLSPPPCILLLDHYESTVVGNYADKIGPLQAAVMAHVGAYLGGDVKVIINSTDGITTFSILELKGEPGTGPYELMINGEYVLVPANGTAVRKRSLEMIDGAMEMFIAVCPKNSYRFGTRCDRCPEHADSNSGSISIDECICRDDKVMQKSTKKCAVCNIGEEKVGNSCLPCKKGHYKFKSGSEPCTMCKEDTWNSQAGSRSETDCRSCSKDRSTSGTKGNVKEESCRCIKTKYYEDNGQCMKCPRGADCSSHDGMPLVNLTALPGYWRYNNSRPTFTRCHTTLQTIDAEKLAQQRCCPINFDESIGVNVSQCTSPSAKSEDQCAIGYTGVACKVCTQGYVLAGNACEECEGGASFGAAFGAAALSCFPVFIGVLIFLLWSKSDNSVSKGNKLIGQVKTLIAFLQILSSVPSVLGDVPWPKAFVSFTSPFQFLNLDFLSLFSTAQCTLLVGFHYQFIIHMSMPPMIGVAVLCAYGLSKLLKNRVHIVGAVYADNKLEDEKHRAQVTKLLFLFIQMLYPALATRIFSMFQCDAVEGVPGLTFLVSDYSVDCGSEERIGFVILAVVFLFVYIIGVPLTIFVVLFKNRNHLYDTSSPMHAAVRYEFGGLYEHYEPEFWWFELVVIVHKMIMT
jgi:hypothetical protein